MSALPAFIAARRSIRAFDVRPVGRDVMDVCIEAACLAPAPHHSRPWRWVVVESPDAKTALATRMGERWREDLARDGVETEKIAELVESSHAKIEQAPIVVLGCLTADGLDRYPDEDRQRAEQGMALLSLGAAVENLMLSATALGLASCWVAAPIFCAEVARDALGLESDWLPHAMVVLGYPDAGYAPRERPRVNLDALRRVV